MNHTSYFALAAFAATAATPEVSNVTMAQSPMTREVTITYALANAPAVVTLDIQTNANGSSWSSIGGEHIWNATGDVWKKVTASGGTISWHPDLSWPDRRIAEGGARAVVTAWSLDNTPDYMVVDITSTRNSDKVRYYPAVDFLPGSEYGQTGAVTNNTAYRDTCLLMRKIMAKDVTWTMGTQATSGANLAHQVTLTNNYYIGVFEITQNQWAYIQTNQTQSARFTTGRNPGLRPADSVSFNEIRLAKPTGFGDNGPSANAAAIAAYGWPNAPHPHSFLGILRSRTGLDFDLPSEAEWEFAARAGHGERYWGDGSIWSGANACANLNRLARYSQTGGFRPSNKNTGDLGAERKAVVNAASTTGTTNGTAVCGSFLPNDWGLYDMHGNVAERCLDWYEANITAFGGRLNVDPANPAKTLSGANGAHHLARGGTWSHHSGSLRPGVRTVMNTDTSTGENYRGAGYNQAMLGLRVVCRAGLK